MKTEKAHKPEATGSHAPRKVPGRIFNMGAKLYAYGINGAIHHVTSEGRPIPRVRGIELSRERGIIGRDLYHGAWALINLDWRPGGVCCPVSGSAIQKS